MALRWLAGAAISALIIELIAFAVLTLRSQNQYRIRYQYGAILTIASIAVAIFVVIQLQLLPYYGAIHNTVTSMLSSLVSEGSLITRLTGFGEGTLILIRERLPALATVLVNVALASTFLAVYPVFRSKHS